MQEYYQILINAARGVITEKVDRAISNGAVMPCSKDVFIDLTSNAVVESIKTLDRRIALLHMESSISAQFGSYISSRVLGSLLTGLADIMGEMAQEAVSRKTGT